MKDPIKEPSALGRNLIILAVSACIGLVSLVKVSEKQAITWALLSYIVIFLFSYGLEQIYLPQEFKKLRSDMAGAVKTANQNDTLKIVLEQIRSEFADRLAKLHKFTYVDEKGTIPQLSVKTIESVKTRAFATFVADNREEIYENSEGRTYLNAWYQKAGHLDKNGELHRVFITGKLGDLTDEAVRLIEEHLKRGVQVSVIERNVAENISEGCELDFGLFDMDCLMTVKPRPGNSSQLSVYVKGPGDTNARELDRYENYRKRLLKAAVAASDFLRDFGRPINAHFWDRRLMLKDNVRLGPPHGLSKADAMEMLDLILRHAPNATTPIRVAILGLTPVLVETCLNSPRIDEIVLVDQTSVAVDKPQTTKKIKVIRSNWLDYNAHGIFDGILGDEALNNLNVQQYRSFFRAMHNCLQPHGVLILRTLGRYEGTEQFLRVPAKQLLDSIRNAAADDSEAERGASIIEYLHSVDIAFDPTTQLIDTKRYNDFLANWVTQGAITPGQAAGFWFPDKANQQLYLSSVDPDQIQERSREYFDQMPFAEVDAAYCGCDGVLRQFYRITPFVLRRMGNEY